MPAAKPTTIAEYIDAAPAQARSHLRELYAILKSVAPDAQEAIKWGYPAFVGRRILYCFAAFKDHANVMPTPRSLEPFREEIAAAGLAAKAGTLSIRYDQDVPVGLIRRIAEHREHDVRVNDARFDV